MDSLTAVASYTAGDLDISGLFAAVSAYQTVWFCDGRPYSATIGDSGYHKLDMTSTSIVGEVTSGPFTAGETISQDTDGGGTMAYGIFIETVGSGATAKNLVYRTTTVDFVTGAFPVEGATASIASPTEVNAPPHWLNWILTSGDFPDGGSNIMCLFEGRLWMNSMYNPNQWFATRQGDPLDFDTSQEDVQTAISSQTSEAGLVADAIVALIPFKDNYLLFGMANSFGILRGGSTGGGNISNLSTETGIFSPESYCWDNNGNLYVVGLTGFFKFPNGMATSGIAIDNLSLRHLPNLFQTIQLNRKTDRVVLGFDRDRNQVNVSISMHDASWSVAWVYDVATDSIFPDIFDGPIPTAYLYMNSYQDEVSGLLVGCSDGYVRKFDSATKSDDETIITSYALFGPLTLNTLLRANIKIQEIQIILSEDADGLSWYLYQAKSNELIVKGIKEGTLTPTHSGTFTVGGRQMSIRDKIAGESVALLFKNSTLNTSWGLEGVKLRYTIAGRVKEG
jgi:hypothetical protein